jgi:hypothetical protein
LGHFISTGELTGVGFRWSHFGCECPIPLGKVAHPLENSRIAWPLGRTY